MLYILAALVGVIIYLVFLNRKGWSELDRLKQIIAQFDSLKGLAAKQNLQLTTQITQKNLLRAVLYGLSDAVIAVDVNKRVTFINETAQEVLGDTKNHILGKQINEVIKVRNKEGEVSELIYCPSDVNSYQAASFEQKNLEVLSQTGKKFYANIFSRQIKVAGIGCVMTLQEVTGQTQLEQMKLDFVSMTAHELRTPLTSLKGYLSVFMKENIAKLDQEQKKFLVQINQSAEKLGALVENLLNVSRIERGALIINVQQIDWVEAARQITEEFKARADEKRIALSFIDPKTSIPAVKADKLRLGEVLSNLLSNAINYTLPGGKVTVSIEATSDSIITHVTDTGQGIPKDSLSRLFTKFFRVSDKLEQPGKGSGLGLYISKSIIDLHHGKIWANSEVGKGSTFSFSLPL